MSKLKKILCLVLLLSFSSISVVHASWDNSKNLNSVCATDQEEIFKIIIDCYIKIREKLIVDQNYSPDGIETIIPSDVSSIYYKGYWEKFMDIVDKIPAKLKVSNETLTTFFWKLIFEDCMRSFYSENYNDSFLVTIIRMNYPAVKKDAIVSESSSALIFKFKNEWVVLDPVLALQAETLEEGIRYLTIPLEQYKKLIIEKGFQQDIVIEWWGGYCADIQSVSLSEINGDYIENLWQENRQQAINFASEFSDNF